MDLYCDKGEDDNSDTDITTITIVLPLLALLVTTINKVNNHNSSHIILFMFCSSVRPPAHPHVTRTFKA